MNRVARVERLTHETQIMLELDLDGIGVVEVGTGVPFFDHMLAQLGKHGSLDLTVRAKGDVEIDAHHTVEDAAITLGQALKEALGDKRSEEHTSELQSRLHLVCRLLLEKKRIHRNSSQRRTSQPALSRIVLTSSSPT